MGESTRAFDRPVFAVDFKNVSQKRTLVRRHRNGPLTAALKVGAAMLATPRDCRMLGADGSIGVPLAKRGCDVWVWQGVTFRPTENATGA